MNRILEFVIWVGVVGMFAAGFASVLGWIDLASYAVSAVACFGYAVGAMALLRSGGLARDVRGEVDRVRWRQSRDRLAIEELRKGQLDVAFRVDRAESEIDDLSTFVVDRLGLSYADLAERSSWGPFGDSPPSRDAGEGADAADPFYVAD